MEREETAQSPIVETMASLVRRYDDLDSILLVSDMLQNTPLWSHYIVGGDSLAVASECRRITNPGRLKTVHVYYIHRENPENHALEWPDVWWRRCLTGVTAEMLN